MSARLARGLVRVAARLIPDEPSRARYREQWLADVQGAAGLGLRPVPIAAGALAAAVALPLPGLSGSTHRRRRILGILQLVFAFPYAWALLGYAVGVIQFGVSGQELFDLRPPDSSSCGTSAGCLPGETWGSKAFIDAQGPLAWFPLIWLTGVDMQLDGETLLGIDGWAGSALLAPFGLVAAIGGRRWSRWLPLAGALAGIAASLFAQTEFAVDLIRWMVAPWVHAW